MEKIKVLLIDDTPSVRRFIKIGIEKNFPNVVIDEASNGLTAKTKLENYHYSLVLCDWEMPGMNGEELLRWLKQQPELCSIPFIMVTAKSEKEDVIKAIQGGVAGYIVKPFTIDSLVQKMTTVVDRFDRRHYERFSATGPISIEFGSNRMDGKLIDVSLGGLFAIFDSKYTFPKILESVTVHIEPDKNTGVKGVDSFVLRLQAADAFQESEFVKLAVKFLDLDEIKHNALSEYIRSIKNSG
ncbi:MAG: response regulator [Dissulfurispiraceae bacterium]|jgi:CheY-like chemotaxis protein|nr:response regulator [Dissulfurispiraceae bacterium]